MISVKNNGYWELEHLSNIELYYSAPENFTEKSIILRGDDFHHITRVMRHTDGDDIYVTNGLGSIYRGKITTIAKTEAISSIESEYKYQNKYGNITFCLPKLKSSDRFEFALEKSIELGISNFIVFNSARTVSKGSKMRRWNKIAVAAMKQSLQSYLPVIDEIESLKALSEVEGDIVVFEQNSKKHLSDLKFDPDKNYYFVFGPEGGLDNQELNLFERREIINLAENRLRTETAVKKAASILSTLV
jgi:16S rRNA (uracil1498-N3)-methyltransferase